MAFFNRERELADIAEFVASPRPELIIVYGRRGVGKSALLAEALSERRHLYYQATTRTLPQQLEDLTAALRTFAAEVVLPGVLPSSSPLTTSIGSRRNSGGKPAQGCPLGRFANYAM